MKKYEYKIKESYGECFSKSKLDDFGKNGWELCGVVTISNKLYRNGIVVCYHFKRAVNNDYPYLSG